MHSVTSNAVARLGEEITGWSTGSGFGFTGTVIKIGKVVLIVGRATGGGSVGNIILTDLPINKGREVQFVPCNIWNDYITTRNSGVIGIEQNSTVLKVYVGDYANSFFGVSIAYITE